MRCSGLYDEATWDEAISDVEREERRRLVSALSPALPDRLINRDSSQFWSIYTLDIYASMAWGSMIHHRGFSAAVSYPSEIGDFLPAIPSDPRYPPPSTRAATQTSWLRGWNFTTDLYRVLERVMDVIASTRRPTTGPPQLTILAPYISTAELSARGHPMGSSPVRTPLGSVMPYVNGLYDALPDTFKHVRPMTGDLEVDIGSFQAANIVVTIYVRLLFLHRFPQYRCARACAGLMTGLDNAASDDQDGGFMRRGQYLGEV